MPTKKLSKNENLKGAHQPSYSKNLISVFYEGLPVGELSQAPDKRIAFSYNKTWLEQGFSISPFSLPLQDKLFMAPLSPHEGLFGVFADSLPDGWGALLLDRGLKKQGRRLHELSPLERLTLLDTTSFGALTYKPNKTFAQVHFSEDYDALYQTAHDIISDNITHIASGTSFSQDSPVFNELLAMGGSSGGARPKVHATINGEDWIVKFPTSIEGTDAGRREYEIAQVAVDCNINMPQTLLLPSRICAGFFGTKRFDRTTSGANKGSGVDRSTTRHHMISAAGLLETSHRDFNLTYEILFQALAQLKCGIDDAKELFRRMVFNVAIGNRDDHAKNFAFLYAPKNAPNDVSNNTSNDMSNDTSNDTLHEGWHLSPAYDLTQNPGYMGERATTINGKGKNITVRDLLTVAEKAGLKTSWAETTVQEIVKRVADTGLNSGDLT